MDDTPDKPRVFLDANVLFAASTFPRWPREVLRHAIKGDFQAVLCPIVIAQARRNLRKRFPDAWDDVAVALAAINAHADYLVSEDKDFTAEDESTVTIRQHLKVMRPVIFLREVMGWTSERLEAIRYRKWSDIPEVDRVEPE
jgi:predicted nucleic acid-binding protein